jgi:hypothetical protein
MSEQIKPYIIRYQSIEGKQICYFSDTKNIAAVDKLPSISQYRQYTLFKGFDASDDGLRLFANDFDIWVTQLKDSNLPLNIYYEKYFHHSDAVILTFKRLCSGLYENHTLITRIENKYWEMCFNGGLMYCDPQECVSFSYDKSSYYPRILADANFEIPTCEGSEQYLLELPKVLKCGIYRVNIICDDPKFRKIFAFSKNSAYTHYSLRTALKYQYLFNVNIKLIIDKEPNAYIYDNNVTTGDKIFKKWFDTLYKIKQKYPKNKLIKHLLSSLWGQLSNKNCFRQSLEQINNNKLDVGLDMESDYKITKHVVYENREYYELQNNKNPYKNNIRLKPFIVSYGRYLMSDIIMENIKAVVRIQTDSVTFNTSMDDIFRLNYKDMVPEAKSSGLINWENVNKYAKWDDDKKLWVYSGKW